MNWDNKIIEEVRLRKERERSDDRDALLVLASDHLYADKIHYALELIQNAEDEGASSITFIFNREYTAVINDGKPFDPEDLLDICSVRPGGKSNKIGFFGVGFKSVFKITDRPQIISSNGLYKPQTFSSFRESDR